MKNPYFANDLTVINRQMTPEQAVPPDVWNKFGAQEREKRQAAGISYAFTDNFIYSETELLPEYTLSRKEGNINTRYYMIDFKQIYRVNCDLINTPANSPLDIKYLELSIEARDQLRKKITSYFGRVPAEDNILAAV